MTVAGLLGRHGLTVAGADRAPDVFPLPRAAHIDHTALRTLQALGCLEELLPQMIENPGLDFVGASGQRLATIPGVQPNPSNLPASMYFHQPGFDRTLWRTVDAFPTVELHRGIDVTAVDQRSDRAIVRGTAAEGSEIEWEAQYVVAADGASSPVRESLGMPLIDLEFHERWLVVDLILREPVVTLPDRAVTYCNPNRPLGFVPMPLGRCRFELMLMDHEDSTAMQEPAAVAELVSPWIEPGAAELERAAVYYFHGLVAEHWRKGRVILAGDAAHQMPPFLGQGMNTGLRDATNLAWKLAMVLGNSAPDTLLDTYELERKPNVRSIVQSAVNIGRIVCVLDPAEAEQRDRELIADPSRAKILAFRLPRLERGPLVLAGGGQLSTQALSDDGIGRFDDVVGERFLVLGRDETALNGAMDFWSGELNALTGTPGSFVGYERALRAVLDRLRADVVVVRPDRYILAAGCRLEAVTEQVRPVLTAPVPTEI
jgi:3-(3-hydroxy-phenyl)propionate hydroxylase